jgi:hypothetical protein
LTLLAAALLVGFPGLAPPAAADDLVYLTAPPGPTPAPPAPLDWPVYLETGRPVGVPDPNAREFQDDSPYVSGRLTLEMGASAYFAPVGLGPHIPTFDYTPVDLRLGCILTTPHESGLFRGSLEALIGGMAAPVVNGFGDVLGGPTLLLRYNFVQPHCRVVPYYQIGGGLLFTDAHEDPNQKAIGQSFEFLLTMGVGCHVLLDDHWSLNVEASYQHISNADLASRNLGVNALGGVVSLTYFFPRGH